MSDQTEPDQTDSNLIEELLGANILFILHENGVTIMMDEELEDRSIEQMKMFSRLFVATRPSFVLRFFLFLEVIFFTISDYIEYYWSKLIKKD